MQPAVYWVESVEEESWRYRCWSIEAECLPLSAQDMVSLRQSAVAAVALVVLSDMEEVEMLVRCLGLDKIHKTLIQ